MACTTDPIAALGEDVFLLVLEHLQPADVIALGSVSRSWRAFVDEHEVWRGVCRRAGIDVREHRHAEGERQAIALGEPYRGDLAGEASPAECQRAYLDDVCLSEAWTRRFSYENLVKAPAFKLRSVYMDHGEDYIYALTESGAMSREECFLVLNKYTGQLLQRIPGITPHANISVGAGYVAVSAYQRDCVRDRRREYSPLSVVTVFRTATAAARANVPWRDRGPLEFACALTDAEVTKSDVMTVALVHGSGHLVATDSSTAHLIDLDRGKRRAIQLTHVDTVDSPLLGERSLSDKEPKIWSVNITDEYLFVVTQYQVHIFTLTGTKVAVYPDPCADYRTHAALAYGVEERYPYSNDYIRAPNTPESAPQGLSVAETLQWEIPGFSPDTHSHQFQTAVEQGMGYSGGGDDSDSDESDSIGSDHWQRLDRFRFDGMNASLQDVTFTTNDMVIRGREGTVFIVRDYRRVLREALDLDARERTAFIGRNTIIIGFGEANDVVTAYRDRVLVHAADSIVFVIDVSQLPTMPWLGDSKTPVPSATVYSFEVSSLEGMQDESSVVMDARAVYMADWDKGMPDTGVSYEHMNDLQRDEDDWPYPIRPCWGCIKVWTFRPTAALLRRPGVVEWAAEQRRISNMWHLPHEWDVPPIAEDWEANLSSVAGMLGEDVSWREDEDESEEEEDSDGDEDGDEGEGEDDEDVDEAEEGGGGSGSEAEEDDRWETETVQAESDVDEASEVKDDIADGGEAEEVLIAPMLSALLQDVGLRVVE